MMGEGEIGGGRLRLPVVEAMRGDGWVRTSAVVEGGAEGGGGRLGMAEAVRGTDGG